MVKHADERPRSDDPPPAGLIVLAVLGSFLGTGFCCCGMIPVPWATAAAVDITGCSALALAFQGALAAAPIAILAPVGLWRWARRPWGWALAASCQLFTGALYVLVAVDGAIGDWYSPRGGPGGPVGIGALFGLGALAHAFPAAVALLGFAYLMLPRVRAAFGVLSLSGNRQMPT